MLLVISTAAADLAAEDDALGGHQRLAGDARLGVLGQEQVDDRVGNLVGDLVGMAFGNGFGGEEIGAAHGRGADPREYQDIKKSLYGAPLAATCGPAQSPRDQQQRSRAAAG